MANSQRLSIPEGASRVLRFSRPTTADDADGIVFDARVSGQATGAASLQVATDIQTGPWWEQIYNGTIRHTAEEAASGTVHYDVDGIGSVVLTDVSDGTYTFVAENAVGQSPVFAFMPVLQFSQTDLYMWIKNNLQSMIPADLGGFLSEMHLTVKMFSMTETFTHKVFIPLGDQVFGDNAWPYASDASHLKRSYNGSPTSWWLAPVEGNVPPAIDAEGVRLNNPTGMEMYGVVPMFQILEGGGSVVYWLFACVSFPVRGWRHEQPAAA